MHGNSGWVYGMAAFVAGPAMLAAAAETMLPAGPAPKPVAIPHFPDRMHAFVFRNWSLVGPLRLAKVLGTSPENVIVIAESMGLPAWPPVPGEFKTRGYITLVRRNWHLLPYDQLLTLLDVSAEQLAHSLREDDFLFIKLGRLKPACEALRYAPPDEKARRRAAEIKKMVEETFGEELREPAEPRFQFVRELSRMPAARVAETRRAGGGPGMTAPRYIYSYFALYGDPLSEPELDPFPDGLLARLADLGINGVWVHTVLRQLAPSKRFPEFGQGSDMRLANLRRLVERAGRYGIGIYLYCNEPRAMPAAFFRGRADMAGVREDDYVAMCTSSPQVREWLSDSLAYVFGNVPDLAGVFTITASENLTNCASHGRQTECSRCRSRPAAAILAEVNRAIEAGVHRANPKAHIIVWDWGWNDAWAPEAIADLPKSAWFMSVSEWAQPFTRGGVSSAVGEYSISVVGPGPRAKKHWALAKEAGLRTVAKMQINITWELSAVPYLPVLDLVADHCRNLATTGVDGLMLSWTLGGYPSPNLEVAERFSRRPAPAKEAVLDDVAVRRFGRAGAPHARKAWTAFSRAFTEYPYDGGVVYACPVQCGPSNLLYAAPSGYKATMVGFPYDDLDSWRGPYPAEVFADQFARMADGWEPGLAELRRAVSMAPAERLADASAEERFAEAAHLHFRSVANQSRFTYLRNSLTERGSAAVAPTGSETEARNRMREIVLDEIRLARRLFTLSRQDSRIGYEASNHYYYVPVDLVEKVINCRYVLDVLSAVEASPQSEEGRRTR